MKGFYEWLENNNFGVVRTSNLIYLFDGITYYCVPTKRMLIGFMLEYLWFRDKACYGWSHCPSEERKIENYYEELKEKIEAGKML